LATVEFQHGLLNAFHPGYAWSNVKPEDSTHIPIADRLFLFGDYWRETLETMRFWNDRLDVVGSLRLDGYRERGKALRREVRTVVFTTQGIDVPQCVDFVRDAWADAASDDSLRLVVKLHPVW